MLSRRSSGTKRWYSPSTPTPDWLAESGKMPNFEVFNTPLQHVDPNPFLDWDIEWGSEAMLEDHPQHEKWLGAINPSFASQLISWGLLICGTGGDELLSTGCSECAGIHANYGLMMRILQGLWKHRFQPAGGGSVINVTSLNSSTEENVKLDTHLWSFLSKCIFQHALLPGHFV